MKCFCVNCFDVKEIIDYIELNGTYGHCLICKSGNVKRISADRIGRVLKAYLDDTHRDRKAEVRKSFRKRFLRNNGWNCYKSCSQRQE